MNSDPIPHAPASPVSEGGLTRRAILTFFSGMLQQGARFFVAFFVTPIVIRGLGAELYGAWTMMQQTVGYLALSDMRPMGTLKFTLGIRQHVDEIQEKQQQIGAALIVWAVTFPLFLILGVIVVWATPSFIRSSPGSVWAIQVAMAVIVLSVALDRLLSLPGNVLRGMNLDYKAMGLNAITILLGGGITVWAIVAGWGLPGLAIATVFGVVLTNSLRLWVVRRVLPWFKAARPTRTLLISFAKLSVWLFLSGLTGILLTGSDLLLVGVIIGPSSAAVYATTGAVLRLTIEPIWQLLASGSPGIIGLCGQKDWRRVESLRIEMHQSALLVMSIIGAGVIALNESFLGLWVKEGFFGGNILNVLLVLIAFETLIFRVDSIIIDGLLEFRSKSWAMLLCGSLGLIAASQLAGVWGSAGIAFGFFLGYSALVIYFPFLMRRRTGISVRVYAHALARPLAVAALVLLGAYGASSTFHPDNWLRFIAMATLVGGVTTGIVWQFGLPHVTRMSLVGRIRSAVSSRILVT